MIKSCAKIEFTLKYAFFEIASTPISTLNSKVANEAKLISKSVKKYLFVVAFSTQFSFYNKIPYTFIRFFKDNNCK